MNDDMPLKCAECGKLSGIRYHRTCGFCQDVKFEETILCDLNRAVQKADTFECHAFEPRLQVVTPDKMKIKAPSPTDKHPRQKTSLQLLDSDKIKYERALALQKLKREPDSVYVKIKYHLSWNVFHRMPLFMEAGDLIEPLARIFHDSSIETGGFVSLLYLAPDHVHIFVESDGELSIEEHINRIKDYTQDKILGEYPIFKEKAGESNDIWDDAYFAETVS